jgi:uncharacterized protein YdbL (DUF1318 family)
MSMFKKIPAFKTIMVWFAAMFAAATLMTAHAADPVIDQAKAQGIVGEQFDGYLGIADAGRASADVRRKVDQTNAGRLAEYTRISQKTGDSVQVVAAAMAEKLINNAGSGEMVKPGASDAWRKK